MRLLTDFSRRLQKFNDMWNELLEKYPRKWVAMTEEEELYSADTPAGLAAVLQGAGKSLHHNVVKYIDPEPRIWIL